MMCCGTHPLSVVVLCCFATDVLQQLAGFDPRFFLDSKILTSVYVQEDQPIAYVPQVKVVHHGGHASRKVGGISGCFSALMVTFFRFTVGVGGNVRYQDSLGYRRQRICWQGGL